MVLRFVISISQVFFFFFFFYNFFFFLQFFSFQNLKFSTSAAPTARRLQQRSGWVTLVFWRGSDFSVFLFFFFFFFPLFVFLQPSVFADEEQAVFPDEHLGNQYTLNWAVASYNMSVAGSAYHNLHLRGLAMLAEGKLDKNKAVVCEVDAKSNEHVIEVGKGMSDADFGQLVRRARETLSSSKQLFVHDGSVGLARDAGPTVRSFCEKGSSALMLHHLLRSFRLPLEEEVPGLDKWRLELAPEVKADFEKAAEQVRLGQLQSPVVRDPHAVTQFLVPSLAGPGTEAGATVLDVKRRIIVHTGANANAASVKSGLLRISTQAGLLPAGSVLLKAEAVLGADNKAVLIFGAAPLGSQAWSAEDTLWTADDLIVPVWFETKWFSIFFLVVYILMSDCFCRFSGSETSRSFATKFGDYVEQSGKNTVVVGSRRSSHEVFAASPSAVVFVEVCLGKKSWYVCFFFFLFHLFLDPSQSGRKDGAVRVNPEQARKLGLPDSLVERANKNKIPLFAAPPKAASVDVAKWVASFK